MCGGLVEAQSRPVEMMLSEGSTAALPNSFFLYKPCAWRWALGVGCWVAACASVVPAPPVPSHRISSAWVAAIHQWSRHLIWFFFS